MEQYSCQIIICPGIHKPQFTQEFLQGLQRCATGNLAKTLNQDLLILPNQDYPSYCAIHILADLQRYLNSGNTPIIFIAFSAGVVGAIGAAWGWQILGGAVTGFIALDGWGVPLSGNFPIHRLSHDEFTYWSSALLGRGEENFYGDPAVDHLDLWRKADVCQGWWIHPAQGGVGEKRTPITAAEFIIELLQRYL